MYTHITFSKIIHLKLLAKLIVINISMDFFQVLYYKKYKNIEILIYDTYMLILVLLLVK